MRKLLILLTLAAVSLGTGCIHYIRGDLDYINEKLDPNKAPKKIAYRVNANFYSRMWKNRLYYLSGHSGYEDKMPLAEYDPNFGYGDRSNGVLIGRKEKKVVGGVIDDLFGKNVLHTEKALRRKPENLFFDVSIMFHEVSTRVDELEVILATCLTYGLFPSRWYRWNVYYAIDVYDKSQVSTPEGAYFALGDSRPIKPIARYEYQHVISARYTILGTALLIPHMVGDSSRALTRAVTDMTKEFMADLKDGRRSIVSHNHWRGALGLTLSEEQVGDDRAEEANAMRGAVMAGMSAAQGAMNTYGSMQRGARPGMSPGTQFMANTSALMRTTKDLSLVAKAAQDVRTAKKNQAIKNDNAEERLFATVGDPFKYRGGVKLWWYTYQTTANGNQRFLAYFTAKDAAEGSQGVMNDSQKVYKNISRLESQTFGSPSAAIWFVRGKARQIGDKRYMDIKL